MYCTHTRLNLNDWAIAFHALSIDFAMLHKYCHFTTTSQLYLQIEKYHSE